MTADVPGSHRHNDDKADDASDPDKQRFEPAALSFHKDFLHGCKSFFGILLRGKTGDRIKFAFRGGYAKFEVALLALQGERKAMIALEIEFPDKIRIAGAKHGNQSIADKLCLHRFF